MLNDPGGREKLLELCGVRRVPIVFRDRKFVFGQKLEDVAEFVGLLGPGPRLLPPEELTDKWINVLTAAQRYTRQLPHERLAERVIKNRDRTIRLQCHHIFRIAEAFLETAVDGVRFEDGSQGYLSPDLAINTSDDLVRYGDNVIARLRLWWDGLADKSCQQEVQTFFGTQTLHMLYERCTWHSAQHARQLMAVIERLGIEPNGRLTDEDFAGLPLPERLWE